MMVQALVSALGKMREDHKFEVILGDKGRPYLKKKKKKKRFMVVAVLCFPSKARGPGYC